MDDAAAESFNDLLVVCVSGLVTPHAVVEWSG